MIRINLLAEKRAAREKVPRPGVRISGGAQNLLLAAILVLSVAFVGWWWFSLSRQRANLQEEHRKADRELVRLEEVRKKGELYQRQRDELERKVNLITELKKNQAVPVHILDQVSRNLPDFLWLDSMQEQGNVLTIRGKATNYTSVANFYNNLVGSEWFTNVTQGSVSEAAEGVTFLLTCQFLPPKAAVEGEDEPQIGG
jgi:Tfp pilus assembly protein PilN